MKYLKSCILLLPLLLTGCFSVLEVETTSKVNLDGSIERTIQLTGSENEILETKFIIPRQDLDLWQITMDSVEDNRFLYKANANFESVDELNQSLMLNAEDPGVQITADLEIEKGLFFTRYLYSEKVWYDLPGPDIPMEKYLSRRELMSGMSSESNTGMRELSPKEEKRIERRFEEYLQHKYFEGLVIELREGALVSGHIEELEKVLETNSDSLIIELEEVYFDDEYLEWKSILTKYLTPIMLEDIYLSNIEGFDRFLQGWNFLETLLIAHKISVELPGVIRKNFDNEILGNRAVYTPSSILMFFGGVTLDAESAVARPGALIIGGILMALLLGGSVVELVRKRHKSTE